MSGRKIGNACVFSGEETYRVLFTFQYGKHTYAVVEEKNWLLGAGCYRLKWNVFNGTHIASDQEEGEIADLADMLFERAAEKEDGLTGEHYLVSYREDGRLKTARAKVAPLFCLGAKITPRVFKGVILLLISALITFFCIHTRIIFPGGYAFFPSLERDELITLFWVLGLAIPQACYLLFLNRGGLSTILALPALPHGMLLLLSAMKGNAVIFRIITGVVILFLLVWVIPQMIKMFKTKNRGTRKSLFQLVCATAYGLFGVCVLGSAILSSVCGVSIGTIRPDKEPTEQEMQVVSSYEAAMGCLDEQVWQTLLLTERLNVLQSVCDYECLKILGCPAVQVRAANCEKNVQGTYSALTNTATIDLEHLMNDGSAEVVETLLHEARHAWQHAMVEMYDQAEELLDEEHLKLSVFRMAEDLEYGIDTYYNGEEDFEKYYEQLVEKDSRAFSERRMNESYEAITGEMENEKE